jgi:hypothetical protein
MPKYKIHYELIGKMPTLDPLRDSVDEIILRYEMTKPSHTPEFGLMSPTDRKLYMMESMKSAKDMQRMADAIFIHLAAGHFFGLKSDDFTSTETLIIAMNSLEQQIVFK